MLGHQAGFNNITNADMYISKLGEKKYITRYNAHALSTVLNNLVLLFTLAKVIVFCNLCIIVMNNINL